MPDILSATCGAYPLRYRPGVGVPLLIIHWKASDQSDRWIGGARSHQGRPVAALGAEDMGSFQSPATQVVQDLLDAAGWRDTARIEIVGYSGGGFAALLFGALLSLALPAATITVVACSPQISLWPMPTGPRNGLHARMVKAALAVPGQQQNLEHFGDARPWIAKAWEAHGDRFSARLLYAARDSWDAGQAELLQGAPGVKLIPMPTVANGFFAIVKLRADREAEIDYMQMRLQAGAGLGEAEARLEAVALRDAFSAAVAAEPDILGILVPKRP